MKKEDELLVHLQKLKDFRETSQINREKYRKWFDDREKQEEFENKITSIFSTKWRDPPQHSEINCNAFQIRKCKTFAFIGVLGTVVSTGTKSVYYIKGRIKTRFLDLFSDSKRLLE